MNQILHKKNRWLSPRVTVIVLMLFNLATYVTFANLFPFDPGVMTPNRALIEPSATPADLEWLETESKNGLVDYFFVENSNRVRDDGLQYMLMALGEDSFPPYSLRPLVPAFVGYIAEKASLLAPPEKRRATQINLLQPVMSLINVVILVITSIFIFLTVKKFIDDDVIAGLLAIFSIVNVGSLQTSQYFMLDVLSYGMAAAIFYFFITKRYFLFATAICLGLLVKEVLIIYTALLIYPILQNKDHLLRYVAYAFPIVVTFVSIRMIMGEDPLSMQYGWKISEGEINLNYLKIHLGGNKNIILFTIKSTFTFGLLWAFALLALTGEKKLMVFTCWLIVFLTALANIMLAFSVPRVLFVAYPAIAVLAAIGLAGLMGRHQKNQRASPNLAA